MTGCRRWVQVVWALAVWVLVATLFVFPVAEAQPPVHQVADRWTAWNPPDTVPEGSQVYLIQAGDTLWALAEKFLDDPYRWPQLWEANQYILDAEWIYPGDSLVVPAAGVAVAEGVVGPSITEPPESGIPTEDDPFRAEPDSSGTSRFSTPVRLTSRKPVPLGFESDIYCTGYISDQEQDFPYRLAGSEYEFIHPNLDLVDTGVEGLFGKSNTVKYLLGVGDIVYLEGGRADGLSAGSVLVAVQPEYDVRHPRTKEKVGHYYHYTARVRVLSTQEETSIGEIIASCDPLKVGAMLRDFEPEPVPLRRMTPMRPVNYPSTMEEVEAGPTIILSRDRVISLGQGHLVFVDQGFEDDLAPGDIFTIYRRGRESYPPIVLGEASILSVTEHAALARILRSRYSIYLGDSMVLK